MLLDALEERPEAVGPIVVPWLTTLGEPALPAVQERLIGAAPSVRAHLLALLPAAVA